MKHFNMMLHNGVFLLIWCILLCVHSNSAFHIDYGLAMQEQENQLLWKLEATTDVTDISRAQEACSKLSGSLIEINHNDQMDIYNLSRYDAFWAVCGSDNAEETLGIYYVKLRTCITLQPILQGIQAHALCLVGSKDKYWPTIFPRTFDNSAALDQGFESFSNSMIKDRIIAKSKIDYNSDEINSVYTVSDLETFRASIRSDPTDVSDRPNEMIRALQGSNELADSISFKKYDLKEGIAREDDVNASDVASDFTTVEDLSENEALILINFHTVALFVALGVIILCIYALVAKEIPLYSKAKEEAEINRKQTESYYIAKDISIT
jgi:hypothetical protein